jgi:hypothetical protein
MSSPTRLNDLKALETYLQDRLHAHLARIVPFQVQCVYREEKLWVLVQHPPEIAIDVADTFRAIDSALQAEEPDSPLIVKLYLRTIGQRQPYGLETITIYPAGRNVTPGEAAPELTTGGFSQSPPIFMAEETVTADSPPSIPPPPIPMPETTLPKNVPSVDAKVERSTGEVEPVSLEPVEPAVPTVPAIATDLPIVDAEYTDVSSNLETPAKEESVAIPSVKKESPATAAFVESATVENTSNTTRSSRNLGRLPLYVGGAASALLLAGGTWAFTRPCAIGSCPILTQSAQQSAVALQTYSNPQAPGKAILEAQKQLSNSISQLETIPPWSGNNTQAQRQLSDYRQEARAANPAIDAMLQDFRATERLKKPSPPTSELQIVEKEFSSAIAIFERVPTTSKIYPLAQAKLAESRRKLSEVQGRLKSEYDADGTLQSAQVDAVKLNQRQSQAKTLSEWQSLSADWLKWKEKLNSLPAATAAALPAQVLVKQNEEAISTAQKRLQEENAAAEKITAAKAIAAKAKEAGSKPDGLATAVREWGQAIVSLQEIPQQSSSYTEAQKLVTEYNQQLQKAEKDLKTQTLVAQADKDLKQICQGSQQICRFNLTPQKIDVYLLPEYAKKVMETAQEATNRGDDRAKLGLVYHVKTLGDALEAIGDNARIPLTLYGANNKPIQTYRPR